MKLYLTVLLATLFFTLPIMTKAETIPEDIKKSVTFIFLPDRNGNPVPNGTAFFVTVQIPNRTNNVGTPYLVTAKHVICAPDQSVYPFVIVRLNTRSGTATNAFLPLVTNGNNKNVFFHEDPSVDLAVVAGGPPEDVIDYKALDSRFITTKKDFKDLKISEGTEVFFTGLFQNYFGSARNYPVVRFGRVALITDEKIEWPERVLDSGTNFLKHAYQDLYLVESRSIAGNSGSPVFFSFTEPGSPKLKLAGVMKGYFGDFEPIFAIETAISPAVRMNSGIAAVIPAYKLYEILYGKELTAKRGF